MKRIASGIVTALAVFGLAGNAGAQGVLPLSFEVRGGAGFPTGDFGDDSGAETGFGFEVNAKYQFLPLLSVYAGYDWYQFGIDFEDLSDEIGVEVNGDYVDSGLNAGLHASFASVPGLGGLSPWVRGGLVYHKLDVELEAEGESDSDETDYGLGFEVGAGLSFPLGMVLTATPGVRYVTYEPEFDGEGIGENVSYFIVDVGLAFNL